jgi:hypothetical protein
MKWTIFLLLSLTLLSCSVRKATISHSNSDCDTIYITPNHYHILKEYKCVWLDSTKR